MEQNWVVVVEWGKWSGGQLAEGYETHNDAMPLEQYATWQKSILLECWRTLSDNGAIYYNHKPRILDGILHTPLELNPGLPVRQIVIWARAGGINFSPTYYCPTHEWIIIYAKPDFRLKSKGASGVGDVWEIPQESGTWHPAPFPLALALRAIETTMPPVVVDPMIGSGTTAVAAKMLGVDFLGNEKSVCYARKAMERVEHTAFRPPLLILQSEQTRLPLEMI